MPQSSQSTSPVVLVTDLGNRSVAGIALDYQAGERIPEHRHAEAQLIYAVTGVMTVRTAVGRWVVPPQRAVWVPALETHSIRMTGNVGMRTVYVHADQAQEMPSDCCVVHVAPLLREIVLRIMEFPKDYDSDTPPSRLVAVLLDEIKAADQVPLHLPLPTDPRLRRITSALQEHPGNTRTLAEWSRLAGGSERTLARAFARETRMTFGQWRQQARLLAALELLAFGRSVTATALDLGYESPSAFIATFRRALGTTPGRYFAK